MEMVWRFIPADAGNTVELYAVATVGAVYPRWRGEHWVDIRRIFDPHGLSPLARGTRPPPHPRYRYWRFIPAGAGNTFTHPSPNEITPVYPRWRGEHKEGALELQGYDGLSPLARGTH
ncbi:hypothetical protein SEEJ0721_19313 [Salmonella enterica subsp. enterica serovar Javiana str. 10721]|nr:hypothetical protein SEEJ0721_19313 [Salmonella enterica subsp. enterica serovar Javiana str. 10721]